MRHYVVGLYVFTLLADFTSASFLSGIEEKLPSAFTLLTSTAHSADSVHFPFNPGFPIEAVASLAETLPSHSWEYGAASQALLELYNPTLSVFNPDAFSVLFTMISSSSITAVKALDYAATGIVLGGSGANILTEGDGAVGDPASLGVSAIMLGKANGDEKYADAANGTIDYLLNDAPRFWNGAISQRVDVQELWADWMYMVPPFLAYHAADTSSISLLKESVKQCGAYRQILRSSTSTLWQHVAGPQSNDHGLWATGNGWAAAGMTRVLATVMHAPIATDTDANANWQSTAIRSLSTWIKEILDGAMASPLDNGLLRNYLDNTWDAHGFGEISGSSLLASVAYRMAVLQPDTFGTTYISWADSMRQAVGSHVTKEGIAAPAVNPLAWTDTNPFTTGSPEGQAFVVLMYSAWRDCVTQGVYEKPSTSDSGSTVTYANSRKRAHKKMARKHRRFQ